MAKAAPKLHELLAVDSNLKGQADKCRQDLLTTFDKKKHLFEERTVTFKPTEDGQLAVTEEQRDIQTTVAKELAWVKGIISQSLDVSYQIARTNMAATADLTLDDGTVLATGVPATALLELEKRTNELHALVSGIPTLDPAKGFTEDADKGKTIYRARVDVRHRTKKVQRPLTLAPATDKHAAQVQLISEDVPVGTVSTQEWSGLVTPAQKGDMLERVETLRRAVKTARSRANAAEVNTQDKIGDTLLQYVFKL